MYFTVEIPWNPTFSSANIHWGLEELVSNRGLRIATLKFHWYWGFPQNMGFYHLKYWRIRFSINITGIEILPMEFPSLGTSFPLGKCCTSLAAYHFWISPCYGGFPRIFSICHNRRTSREWSSKEKVFMNFLHEHDGLQLKRTSGFESYRND